MTDLEQIWQQKYSTVPTQLKKIKHNSTVATAFNTNIDAVAKIDGATISELARKMNISADMIESGKCQIDTPKDVLRGIIKCFISGNAEEWIVNGAEIYDWLKQNIGYERLQMGGQGGIVANIMAVLGAEKVVAHTASHPLLQAEQFLDLPNLFAINENGNLQPARQINRADDTPLTHWIIEFAKDDSLILNGKNYICPKANRFIASYDPANLNLSINDAFIRHINENGYDYLILSGFHGLKSEQNGVEHIKAAAETIKKWKNLHQQGIIHLELASTQDKIIRRAIIENIAPIADSLGLNDRETLEVLEVINPAQYNIFKQQKLGAAQLFKICRQIMQTTHTPRLQMHMFGLYITLQNKNFRISPQQNLHGMLLAATIAASKAGLGKLEKSEDFLWAHQNNSITLSVSELQKLATFLQKPEILESGITEIDNLNIIAIPTLIVAKPRTLVGMGDTISSVSIVAAR
jgi:ADP-dependent phosphofructokinase/glucokinase